MPPSVSLLESDTDALHIEARTGETSAVAVPSTLASLSHLNNELSLIAPSPRTSEDVQQGSEIPAIPAVCNVPDCIVDTEMKAASACNDDVSAAVVEDTCAPASDAVNDNLSHGADIAKIVGGKNDLRPDLRYLNIDLSRILEKRNNAREQLKSCRPPISQSSRRQKFKEGLQKGLIDSKDLDVSFENFPYYLRYMSKLPAAGVLLLNMISVLFIDYSFVTSVVHLVFIFLTVRSLRNSLLLHHTYI